MADGPLIPDGVIADAEGAARADVAIEARDVLAAIEIDPADLLLRR